MPLFPEINDVEKYFSLVDTHMKGLSDAFLQHKLEKFLISLSVN